MKLTIIIITQDQSSGDKPQSKTKTKKMYHSPLEESANSHSGENEDIGEVKHTMLDEDQESKSWKTGMPIPLVIIHYFKLNNNFAVTVSLKV